MEDLTVFLNAAQVGFPVLLDANPVHQLYRLSGAVSPFPLDYVIDREGRVAYTATEYDPDRMVAVIDSLLADTTPVPEFGEARLRIRQLPQQTAGAATLMFSLPGEGAVELTIHDLRGRVVARLIDGDVLGRGDDVRTWDGRNDRNRGLASGLYLAHLRQGPRSAFTKIRLIR